MNIQRWFHQKQQYRVALCGHKAVEVGAVCLLMMVQGNLLALTPGHFAVASRSGLFAVVPALVISFTPYARHLINRWTSSAILAICTFFADAAAHSSHYPGEFTEAALTAVGAFAFSVAVSYTPIGKYIDRLAHTFLHPSTEPA